MYYILYSHNGNLKKHVIKIVIRKRKYTQCTGKTLRVSGLHSSHPCYSGANCTLPTLQDSGDQNYSFRRELETIKKKQMEALKLKKGYTTETKNSMDGFKVDR